MRSNTMRRAWVGLLGHDSSISIGWALRLMDQLQEILLGRHAIFASSEYGYHGYRSIARSIINKNNDRPFPQRLLTF